MSRASAGGEVVGVAREAEAKVEVGAEVDAEAEAEVEAETEMGIATGVEDGEKVAAKVPAKAASTCRASLNDLCIAHQLDKADCPVDLFPWSKVFVKHDTLGYAVVYDAVISEYVAAQGDRRLTFVEIGICDQRFPFGSTRVWRKWLPSGTRIVAVDNFCNKPMDEVMPVLVPVIEQEDLDFVYADQGDLEQLAKLRKYIASADIILDDGGHQAYQIILTFHSLFPTLRKGGKYFVEDVFTELGKGTKTDHENAMVLPYFQTLPASGYAVPIAGVRVHSRRTAKHGHVVHLIEITRG